MITKKTIKKLKHNIKIKILIPKTLILMNRQNPVR